MNPFRAVFSNRHTFLPVIHVHKSGSVCSNSDVKQLLTNVDIAQSCDADGAFLIGHGSVTNADMIEMYRIARDRYSDFWLGVNFQHASNLDALSLVPDSECGLWVDNIGVSDSSEHDAVEFVRVRCESSWQGICFGGVAFKHQPPVQNLEQVARRSVRYLDVVTTSGPKTGEPPDPEKTRLIKRTVGDCPVALASGMSVDNVHLHFAADCFLVASQISKTFHDLDPKLVLAFSRRIDRSPYDGERRWA